MSGYVRIHRTLLGHPAFRNESETMAFAWMIAKASWRDTRVRYKGHAISLNRGQLAISQRDMAAAFGRDKAWIERLWKRLKSEAMIEARTEAGVAVITICNYDEYQGEGDGREAADEAPLEAANEAGARQGRGTEQRREEGNKVEETDASASVSRQPLSEALSFWNANASAAGWSQVKSLTAQRPKHLRSRLRENGLEGFKAAIARARASPYLAGADPPSWFTFDWLIKASNFQKLIEGNYDRRNSDSGDPTTAALRQLLGTGGTNA